VSADIGAVGRGLKGSRHNSTSSSTAQREGGLGYGIRHTATATATDEDYSVEQFGFFLSAETANRASGSLLCHHSVVIDVGDKDRHMAGVRAM
jgi:hypothetical protein